MSTPTTVDSPADLRRRQRLRNMRTLALSLLVLAAIVYVLTQTLTDRTGGWGFVNAASEAAMVGAMADWFAVTALFRHPLGLPIPHTAIIPTRKETLGRSLAEFVAGNFLKGPVVADKVLRAEPSRRAGEWLEPEAHRRTVVARAAKIAGIAVEKIKDDDVTVLVHQVVLPRLAEAKKSPIIGQFLADVIADGAHHGLVDLAATELHAWLRDNPDTVSRIVQGRAPWWSPQWVNDTVTGRIHQELLAWVADVRDRPAHPARKSIDTWLAKFADDLQYDEGTRARAEAVINKVLAREDLAGSVLALWKSVQRSLIDSLEDEDGVLRARGLAALGDFARRLTTDREYAARLDAQLAGAADTLATMFGPELATVISDTVERWDGKEAADKIELHVGPDLQFIRINGTVVGALVGVIIHALTLLLP